MVERRHETVSLRDTRTGPTLSVTPTPLGGDVPASIRLSGLAPGDEVTIHAELGDKSGNPWMSEATFLADRGGRVDLTRQAPQRGSYDGVDPMGLLWSAQPREGQPGPGIFACSLTPTPASITAALAGRMLARVDVPLSLLTPDIFSEPVDLPGAVASLYRPVGGQTCPAVIVLGGSEGGLNPYAEREATLFASHGYAALALAYFGSGSLPLGLENIPLEYFGRMIEWLRERRDVDGDCLSVVGHSRGGELALLLGATFPALKAVVSYVGSGLVYAGPDSITPVWTLSGKPVPFVNFGDESRVEAATIAVERIDGPVLLISGQRDLLWPSFALSQIAMDRLVARGHQYRHEHLAYRDAGHFIQAPYLPIPQRLGFFGGTAAGTAEANADSWLRVLEMLDDRLKR
jgi:dienelactone hydrolase